MKVKKPSPYSKLEVPRTIGNLSSLKIPSPGGSGRRKLSRFKTSVLKVLKRRGTRFSKQLSGREKSFGYDPDAAGVSILF